MPGNRDGGGSEDWNKARKRRERKGEWGRERRESKGEGREGPEPYEVILLVDEVDEGQKT